MNTKEKKPKCKQTWEEKNKQCLNKMITIETTIIAHNVITRDIPDIHGFSQSLS